MAKFLRKLEDGRELYGFDFNDVTIKSVGEYEIEMIGTTSDIDRDGEVLSVTGWDLSNYLKNPVILPAHDYTQPAIGRAKSVRMESGKLVFVIEFPQEGVNPLADIYRKLYKSGFMKASSVGFIPIEWTNGNGEKEPRRTYMKQELLELSLVSVPANPMALLTAKGIVDAVEKGIITETDIEAVEKKYAATTKTEEKAPQIVDGRDLLIEKLASDLKSLNDKLEALSVAFKELEEARREEKQASHYSEALFSNTGGAEFKDSLQHAPEVQEIDFLKAVQEGITKGLDHEKM